MATNTEPMWYQKWLKNNKLSKTTPVLSQNPANSSITFNAGPDEMLKVAEDGFYVRGKKLEIDDKEAEQVYNAFKEWLAWSTLNR